MLEFLLLFSHNYSKKEILIGLGISLITLSLLIFIPSNKIEKPKKKVDINVEKIGESTGKITKKFGRGFIKGWKEEIK